MRVTETKRLVCVQNTGWILPACIWVLLCMPSNAAPVFSVTRVSSVLPAVIALQVPMLQGSAVARAVGKFFGKEGVEQASEYLAKKGGLEVAERVGKAAIREGGEETAEQVAALASKYGPEALSALDNAPSLKPLLGALDEIPEAQVRTALTRLSAGPAGRELAETVGRYGAPALRCELKHPGVGGLLVRTLGSEGAEIATKLNANQAVSLARHAGDLAKLPMSQRTGVLSILRNDAERMVGFMGRFASANPGMTLFTAATTTVILAEPDRILGGDEIVFDAEGNPIVVSKAGIAGRTLAAGGEAAAHVSMNYLRPLYISVLAFVIGFAVLWTLMKFYHINQRERLLTQAAVDRVSEASTSQDSTATIEGSVVKRE